MRREVRQVAWQAVRAGLGVGPRTVPRSPNERLSVALSRVSKRGDTRRVQMRPRLRSTAMFVWVFVMVVLGSALVLATFMPGTETVA